MIKTETEIRKQFEEQFTNGTGWVDCDGFLVIDYWLNILRQDREELKQAIEGFPIMKGSVIDKLEEKTERERITNRLNENLEIGYKQACIDILSLLQSKHE